MKFELENRKKPGFLTRALIPFSDRPDTHAAAKSGSPQMDTFKPGMPLNVPETARGGANGVTDVTISTPNRDILDKAPDARAAAGTTPPATGDTPADKSATTPPATTPATPAAAPAQETKPGEGSIAVTSASANAKAIAARKAKPPKAVAPHLPRTLLRHLRPRQQLRRLLRQRRPAMEAAVRKRPNYEPDSAGG
jgi:hypothetical protein